MTVFEKEGHSGGRCSLIEKNGYRFDQGPSLLLLPKLFEETFNDLGTSLKAEGVDIRKCEPNYNIHFKDGSHMELSTDLTRMKAEIEQYEGLSGFANYLAFLQEAGQHYDLSVEHVLHRNFYSLLSLFRWGFLKSVLVLHPFVSIVRLPKSVLYCLISRFVVFKSFKVLSHRKAEESVYFCCDGA